MSTYPDRPRPLRAAASRMSALVGITGSLVTALIGFGILNTVQGDALLALLGAIPGVITLVSSLLSAFGVVRSAEPLVTPLSDPRNDRMERLIAPNEVPESRRRD